MTKIGGWPSLEFCEEAIIIDWDSDMVEQVESGGLEGVFEVISQ
jgi:hypothetical protein